MQGRDRPAGRPCVPGRPGPAPCPGPRCAGPHAARRRGPARHRHRRRRHRHRLPGARRLGPHRLPRRGRDRLRARGRLRRGPGHRRQHRPAPRGHRIPRPGTLGGRAARDADGQLCRDADVDRRTDPRISASTGTRSSIIVPLVHDGVADRADRGGARPAPDAFDEDDLELLGMLAEVASSRLATAYADALRTAVPARPGAGGGPRQELTGLAWWELDLVTGAHHWSEEMFRLVGLEPSDAAARRRRLPRLPSTRTTARRPRRAAHRGLQHRPARRLPGRAPRRPGAAPAGVDRRTARRARPGGQGHRRDHRRHRPRGGARDRRDQPDPASPPRSSSPRPPWESDSRDRRPHLVRAHVRAVRTAPRRRAADAPTRPSPCVHPDDRRRIRGPWASRPSRPGSAAGDGLPGRAAGRDPPARARLDRRTAQPDRCRSPTSGAPAWTSPSRRRAPRGWPPARSTSGSRSTTRRSACR